MCGQVAGAIQESAVTTRSDIPQKPLSYTGKNVCGFSASV